MSKPVGWSFVSCENDWRAPEIREFWARQIGQGLTANALYRSQAWLEHLHTRHADEPCAVALWHDGSGALNGLVPLRLIRKELTFDLANRRLARFSLRVILILGSLPLCPQDEPVYDQLFGSIAKAFPDCDGVGLNFVFQDSFLWKYLKGSVFLKANFLPFWPGPSGIFAVLPLAKTFDEFMARFDKKKRYNLKRQERILREKGQEGFVFHRVASTADVPHFIRALQNVPESKGDMTLADTGGSWGKMEETLGDLAARGLLRSYCLMFGDVPLALMLSYRHRNTLYVEWTRFNTQFAHLSPGTALLQMVVKDVIETDNIEEIQLGIVADVSHYKSYDFTLRQSTPFFLLRKTLRNRTLRLGYPLFESAKRGAQGLMSGLRRGR